jgi:hypothetical protein
MDEFYRNEQKIPVTLVVQEGEYTINKIKYEGKNYLWNTSNKCFINGSDKITVKKDDKKPDKVNLFKSTGEGCEYEYLEIDWKKEDETLPDIRQSIVSKIPANANWILYPYTERDLSCGNSFIQDILAKDRLECSKEETDSGDKILRNNLNQTDPVHLVNIVNSVCLSSLRKLSYNEKISLFTTIARQEELKEYSELALLRLMNALYTEDYKAFYSLLESDNNQLIKHLINEIDDLSIYFWTDKHNYTNFIGALITMFAIAPESYLERFYEAGDEKLLSQIYNLNPNPFKSDFETNIFSGEISLHQYRYNGQYDALSGNITVIEEEKRFLSYAAQEVWVPVSDGDSETISPLTPVLITTDRELPLVETALEGGNITGNYYIVPAIFFKFKGDKEFNEAMESTAMITLDAAIIAGSGGTALAAKVTWARRIWALAEVTAATVHIGIETGAITNEKIREVNDIFYMAMGVIGIKNLGKGVVHFAQNLPNNVKTLIRENKSIRKMLGECLKR